VTADLLRTPTLREQLLADMILRAGEAGIGEPEDLAIVRHRYAALNQVARTSPADPAANP
jgi:hypothetical protein